MILAQITNQIGGSGLPDPQSYSSVGWVLWILVGIIVGLRQVMGFWRDLQNNASKQEIVNQPLSVKMATQFVQEEECAARHADSAQQIADIKRSIDELRLGRTDDTRAAAASREEIYKRVDAVRLELSKKIDEMPALIVTQLLNSKQFWK